MPTPQRLFCRPFEDLLVSSERKEKQKGRIARSSVDAVWKWLAEELMSVRHYRLTTSLGKAIVADDEEQIDRDLNALWREAATVLKAALADQEQRDIAVRKLRDAALVEDAAEMGLMLAQAQTVIELQTRLPKPVAQLTQEDVWFLCDLIDRLTASDSGFRAVCRARRARALGTSVGGAAPGGGDLAQIDRRRHQRHRHGRRR